jgi:sulfate permease, SulP family
MAEKKEFRDLLRDWRTGSVLIATFGLTIVEDLTVGIIAGCVLAAGFAIFDRAVRKKADDKLEITNSPPSMTIGPRAMRGD